MAIRAEKIWMDGKLVNWGEANVHVMTLSLHYGLGTFEGIRAYEQADGSSAVFRLDEHLERLLNTAHMLTLEMEYSQEQLRDACIETLKANGLKEGYIRPLVFVGSGGMGLGTMTNPTHVSVIVWPWGAYLGDDALSKGIRCCMSSYTRDGVASSYSKGKVTGSYVGSIMAKRDALRAGFDEALMLGQDGYVAEGSGENLFMISKGVIYTPPFSAPILGGITRASVMQLASEAGIEVVERQICREELYVADEVFLVGTAAEVTPVREIDFRRIGSGARGPITEQIQSLYFEAVKGESDAHPEWLAHYAL